MNSFDQAQKGLKTFLITLVISLSVFGVFYYIVSVNSAKESTPDIEDSAKKSQVKTVVASAEPDNESPFGELNSQKPDVAPKAVLSGEDYQFPLETTQSTVPDTGVESITWGILISVTAFAVGIYTLISNPRKKALANFEKRVKKGL